MKNSLLLVIFVGVFCVSLSQNAPAQVQEPPAAPGWWGECGGVGDTGPHTYARWAEPPGLSSSNDPAHWNVRFSRFMLRHTA